MNNIEPDKQTSRTKIRWINKYIMTLFLILISPSQQYQNIEPSITIKHQSFDKEQFDISIEQIKQTTLQKLQQYESESQRDILYKNNQRSLEQQRKIHQTWASQTTISLHNIGAGADFLIIRNKKILKGTTNEESTYYQILWWIALKYGLFWWLPRDIWHVATHRRIHEALEQYPDLCNHPSIIQFYENHKSDKIMNIKYQKLMKIMDQHTKTKEHRTYTGVYHEDQLLEPILTSN